MRRGARGSMPWPQWNIGYLLPTLPPALLPPVWVFAMNRYTIQYNFRKNAIKKRNIYGVTLFPTSQFVCDITKTQSVNQIFALVWRTRVP